MPKQIKVLYTPFEGSKKWFSTVSEACSELGLNYNTINIKLRRQELKGDKRLHVWEFGKIEVLNE